MTDGTTEAGTVRIIMVDITEDGTTRGTGAVTGDGMTLGTALTIADGTADGIHIGAITIITDTARDTSEFLTTTRMYGTVQDTRQAQKEYSEAAHHSGEESAAEAR